jgi:uncharacterized protein (UPF0218 family)
LLLERQQQACIAAVRKFISEKFKVMNPKGSLSKSAIHALCRLLEQVAPVLYVAVGKKI